MGRSSDRKKIVRKIVEEQRFDRSDRLIDLREDMDGRMRGIRSTYLNEGLATP